MSASQSRALAGGIALHAGALTVLEIALVRLYSAVCGQHVGLVWAAVPLLGMGLGALFALLLPGIGKPPRGARSVAHVTAASAGAAAIAIVFAIRAKNIDSLDKDALLQLALYVGTSLLPFVLSGASFVGAIGAAERRAARVGRSGLFGVACGVVAAAFVMRFGPARVGLGAAIVASVAGVLYAVASRKDADGRRAQPGVVATFVLGTSVLLAGEIGAPYLKLAGLRWIALERVDWQLFTDRGMFTVDKPQANSVVMRVDGMFGTTILEGKQHPPVGAEDLPYFLHRDKGPVLIVGAGGAREIKVALRQGQKEIFAVEPEPVVVTEVMRGRSRAFSGEIYDKPEVKLSLDGARSYVRRAPGSVRAVIVPNVDTAPQVPTGALVATPMPALTVEAFVDFLSAVVPEGTVSVTRPEAEVDRLIALAAGSLVAMGEMTPADHLYGCAKDKLATLLVKRTAFRKEELASLRAQCKRVKFAEVLPSEGPPNATRRLLSEGGDPAAFSAQGIDLRPPTDDRPFWFSTLAPSHFRSALFDKNVLKISQRALLSIMAGLSIAALLGVLAFLGPLLGRPQRSSSRGEGARAALGLAGVTAALVLVSKALLARLEPTLGRADLVSMVLPLALFLALGTGYALGDRSAASGARGAAQRSALVFVCVLAPLLMGLEMLLGAALGLSLLPRLFAAGALLFALATPLGAMLGASVRIASSNGERVLAWSFAVASCSAAISYFAETLVAMTVGHSAALMAGGVIVLFGALLLPQARRPVVVVAPRPEPPVEDFETPIADRVTLPEM